MRTYSNGKQTGGQRFSRQYIYRLLSNKIYLGQIIHKGVAYQGQHEAIIDQETWDKAQAVLKQKAGQNIKRPHVKAPALLRGLVHCHCCQSALVEVKTKRRNRIYAYYTPTKAIHLGYKVCSIGPIPSGELNNLVLGQIRHFIQSPEVVSQVTKRIELYSGKIDSYFEAIRGYLAEFDHFWAKLPAKTAHEIVCLLVKSVCIEPEQIIIEMNLEGFSSLMAKFEKEKGNDTEVAAKPKSTKTSLSQPKARKQSVARAKTLELCG